MIDIEGWVKIYRKTLSNPVICKDAETLSIWIYLLLNATHKELPEWFSGKKIILTPGQLVTGRKKIASFLSVTESKVQRTLKCFENEHQIEQQTCSSNRLITIVAWESYQVNEQQIEHQTNDKRTTSEQQTNTYKNVKNVKNEKKDIKTIVRFTPPDVSEVRDYCNERNNNVNPNEFVDFYASKGWMVGKNKMKDWKASVRTWERSNKKTVNNKSLYSCRLEEVNDW